jgi:hypothetical protein
VRQRPRVGEDARGERDRVDAGADGRVMGRQIHARVESRNTFLSPLHSF